MENEIVRNTENEAISGIGIKKMNFFQKLLGIIISPDETTRYLAFKPGTLFPTLLFLIAPPAAIFIWWAQIENYLRQSLDTAIVQNQGINFTPEMIDSMMNMYKVMFPVIIVAFLFLFWLIGTAIIYGCIKLFSGEGKFKQYMSVTGYASIIFFISAILTYGSYLLTGTMLDLSPAVLMPDPTGSFALGFAKGILSSLNILSLWFLWVICIGFKNVSKQEKGKIYGIVIILYAVLTIISALLTGYGTAMM